MSFVSHRDPVFAAANAVSCRAQDSDKSNELCISIPHALVTVSDLCLGIYLLVFNDTIKREEQAVLIFERKIFRKIYMVLNMKTGNGKVRRIEN